MTDKPDKEKPRYGPDSEFKGKAGRSGPPKGNRNGIRHGLKAGKLPADAKYIEDRLNVFRRQLEDAVLAAKCDVSISDAASIQTALRWERHAALTQRWLTKQYEVLKPTERLTFSREIARASGERDRALRDLKLDRDMKNDLLESLYSRPRITDAADDKDDATDDSEGGDE